MKKIVACITLSAMVISFFPLYAKDTDKLRVAIMDFSSEDLSKADARKISDLIRTEMINTGQYTVIERNEMNKILNEQGFQMTGCTDVSCAVQAGKLMSARKILVGTIMKIDQNIIINGRIVDVEKGTADFAEKELAKSKEDVYRAVEAFAAKLTKRISPEGYAKQYKEYESRATTPKKKSPMLGALTLGGIILTVACAGVVWYSDNRVRAIPSDNSLHSTFKTIRLATGLGMGAVGLATIGVGIAYLVEKAKEDTIGMNGDININNTYSVIMNPIYYNNSFNNYNGKSNFGLGVGISMKF
jgi:TolB-like protein